MPEGYDRAKEMELATGWGNAMMSCQEFFDDQDVFWMWRKSISWMNNEILSPDELKALKIDLPTVQKKVTELVLGNQVEKHTKHHKKPPSKA